MMVVTSLSLLMLPVMELGGGFQWRGGGRHRKAGDLRWEEWDWWQGGGWVWAQWWRRRIQRSPKHRQMEKRQRLPDSCSTLCFAFSIMTTNMRAPNHRHVASTSIATSGRLQTAATKLDTIFEAVVRLVHKLGSLSRDSLIHYSLVCMLQ